jgi:hypothetical protein
LAVQHQCATLTDGDTIAQVPMEGGHIALAP